MKSLLLVCALATVAHADPQRDVAHGIQEAFDHGLMGVTVYGPDGTELHSELVVDLLSAGKTKLGKLTVGVVAERPTLAWFQGPLTVGSVPYRVSGVFLDGTVQSLTFAKVVSDADLIAAAKKAAQPMPDKPLSGADSAGRVASWVSHGFAPGITPSVVAAGGTAPSEYAVGQAGVKKLVAGWDKLKLVPVSGSSDENTYGLQVVHLRVMMPIKGTKLGVPMELTAIVRYEEEASEWQSLQFSPVL